MLSRLPDSNCWLAADFIRANESVEKANFRKFTCSPLYGSLCHLVWGGFIDSADLLMQGI
jgi:hypothetical protein